MKFYGNGVVWDAANKKALCKFVKGELETSDRNVMEKLDALGYKHDGWDPAPVAAESESAVAAEAPEVDAPDDDIKIAPTKAEKAAKKGAAK